MLTPHLLPQTAFEVQTTFLLTPSHTFFRNSDWGGVKTGLRVDFLSLLLVMMGCRVWSWYLTQDHNGSSCCCLTEMVKVDIPLTCAIYVRDSVKHAFASKETRCRSLDFLCLATRRQQRNPIPRFRSLNRGRATISSTIGVFVVFYRYNRHSVSSSSTCFCLRENVVCQPVERLFYQS